MFCDEVGTPSRDGPRSTWSRGLYKRGGDVGGGLGSCARPVWISLHSLVQDVPNMPFNFLFDTAMVALVSLFDGIVT